MMTPRKKSSGKKEAVLLIGSGYGSLKVAEDLAQSGIPVVWVTGAQHFLELPEGTEDFVELPVDLNYQFRPLYLRVTRHPLVTPLTDARVESIESNGSGFQSVIVQNPLYIDYNLCTGCGRCIEVCPLSESEHPPLSRTPAYCPSRSLELEKRKISACRVSCPLNVNVQAYMALIAANRFEEALAVIKEDNPLPGICGRVCHHPCEDSCRREELDQPVAICDLKRFLADWEADQGVPQFNEAHRPDRPERVAIVGSGPSGLTAAYFLSRAGFPVTIFESLTEPGGMLRAGINAFRLPRKVLDAEIQAIRDTGVEIRTGEDVHSLDELFEKGFHAVLLCTGTHADLRLNIPGEDLSGIIHCVQFLYGVNIEGRGEVGEHTVVIGAGNSAMDAARTALRLGAGEVTLLGIEGEDEMPAHPREIREAREEGVQFKLGAAPVSFEGSSQVERIVCRPAHWDYHEGRAPELIFDSEDTFILEADTVIVSIGQRSHLSEFGINEQLKTGRNGSILVDEGFSTSRSGVFAAGDIVTGPSSVVNAMASGRNAAGRIIEYLTGKPSPFEQLAPESRGVGDYAEITDDIPRQWRPEMAQRQPRVRCRDFEEVDFGFTMEQAIAESQRCLQCGSCCECRSCETVCTDIGAIDHFRQSKRLRVMSPSVIVADESEISGLDVNWHEGIYRVGDFSESRDLMNIMLVGSSSAGQAMARAVELRESAIPEKRQMTALPGESTIGFFICTCNETMAPLAALERIRDIAMRIPQVRCSELIFSACHPLGSEQIARACREQDLNRVIVASCVCCPLEFQCISCNDQRTRARVHLFDRLGLERSQFEMINLKDHLDIGDLSEDEIVDKARELLRSAFIRARFIEQLRQGFTEIGNKILILGGSEIGISCAMNLDLQGFRVRLIHKCRLKDEAEFPDYVDRRVVDKEIGRSIDHVEEAVIEEIRGHAGDFTVLYNENGKRGRWQADMVCLTDVNLLPLVIDEDMVGLKKLYRYNFSFFHTPQPGFYRVFPRTLDRINAFEAGMALAAQVAKAAAESFLKDHELSPRIDPERCRGCGRCAEICPFGAIRMIAGPDGIYHAEILRHNCVGCGGCVGRCPVTAMNMPYFSNEILDEILAGTLAGEGNGTS